MNKYRVLTVLLGTLFLLSCTVAQIEKSKKIAAVSAKFSVAALPFMAKISFAYGAPYASIVSAFAEALVPDYEPPEQEEYDDEDYDDEDYDDDEYGDEEYEDEDYDDEYDDYDDYSDELTGSRSRRGADNDDAMDTDTLSVQVNVLKERQSGQRIRGIPLKNGDTLTQNDNYKLQLRCNMECYAYIAQLDSTGRMDPIMPSALVPDQNPLFSNQTYAIPQGSNWFYLDSNTGVEQIYFIFSRTPRDDIDLIFERLATANANLVQRKSISIEKPLMLTKGIAGVRKGSSQNIQLSNGAQGKYISTVLQSIEAELVITKWFRHE